MQRIGYVLIAGSMSLGLAWGQGSTADRAAAGHPDLSGLWDYAIDLPSTALKLEQAGEVSITNVDRSGRLAAREEIPHALPSQPAPVYKAEFEPHRKDLFDHESRTDPVFYCGRPGIPRIGPPRKIVQLPTEMIFLYEDMSGDPYRVIPTDGRAHREDVGPSHYGDSIARWDGDVLVVDAVNFVDDTWFGEGGFFHSEDMHVTERLWLHEGNLVYQATVEDSVLAQPWTTAPRVIKPTDLRLEESPKCVESDADRLLNDDHHGQR